MAFRKIEIKELLATFKDGAGPPYGTAHGAGEHYGVSFCPAFSRAICNSKEKTCAKRKGGVASTMLSL
jgi:hypothetical protein